MQLKITRELFCLSELKATTVQGHIWLLATKYKITVWRRLQNRLSASIPVLLLCKNCWFWYTVEDILIHCSLILCIIIYTLKQFIFSYLCVVIINWLIMFLTSIALHILYFPLFYTFSHSYELRNDSLKRVFFLSLCNYQMHYSANCSSFLEREELVPEVWKT